MPTDSQKAYFALRAFNVELASIKDGGERRRASHSEEAGSTLAQRMRMEWWRDSLLQIYSAVDESKESDVDKVGPEPSVEGFLNSSYTSCWNNPIVRALGNAVQEKQLTKRFLERMLDARLADLDIQQLRTMEDAIFYAEDSSANLLYLSLECVGVSAFSAFCVCVCVCDWKERAREVEHTNVHLSTTPFLFVPLSVCVVSCCVTHTTTIPLVGCPLSLFV